MKRLVLFLMVLICVPLMAQTVETDSPSLSTWQWIIDNQASAVTALVFILSFISRLIPTKFTFDLLKWVTWLLDVLVGDKKKSGGDFYTEIKDASDIKL